MIRKVKLDQEAEDNAHFRHLQKDDADDVPKARFVALSRFVVANGMEAQVIAAFLKRPHLVDDTPGFVRMEVLSPRDNLAEFWLMTYWAEEADFKQWHHSHAYHASHCGIPKGLKLVPGETRISHFNHICS